ncbi:MAG: zinc ABC transporter solute-binding protein [Proteobacteria bacterium]|nr:zinc ABC transporter solute-binding protein [Pseudomonadota bacterium]
MRYRWLALWLTIVAILFVTCSDISGKGKKPIVVVSVLPQQYFAERIAGDLIDVVVMIPPGANPAAYEPTMEHMMSLAKASLYIKVGHPSFPFEKAWLDKLLSYGNDLEVVDSSSGIQLLKGDPHVWVSPTCARFMATNITAALKKQIPSKKALFDTNLKRFINDIDTLDSELKEVISRIKKKSFYVSHPAWGYLAEEYGLEQVAIEHEHKEPSPHGLQEIVLRAQKDNTKVIFAQPQISQVSAELMARELGGRVVVVDPLSKDWLQGMRQLTAALDEALSQ